MTETMTTRKEPRKLSARELEALNGGFLSIELENTLISSFKADRGPEQRDFSWGDTREGSF